MEHKDDFPLWFFNSFCMKQIFKKSAYNLACYISMCSHTVKEYTASVNFVGGEEDPRCNTNRMGLSFYIYISGPAAAGWGRDTREKSGEDIQPNGQKPGEHLMYFRHKQRRPSKTYFSSNQTAFFLSLRLTKCKAVIDLQLKVKNVFVFSSLIFWLLSTSLLLTNLKKFSMLFRQSTISSFCPLFLKGYSYWNYPYKKCI